MKVMIHEETYILGNAHTHSSGLPILESRTDVVLVLYSRPGCGSIDSDRAGNCIVLLVRRYPRSVSKLFEEFSKFPTPAQ